MEKLATCRGRYGSGADYLCQTAAALRAAGLDDPHLDRLCDLLTARETADAAIIDGCDDAPVNSRADCGVAVALRGESEFACWRGPRRCDSVLPS